MTPNITVNYMAEQINWGRLDSVAARGWLADEAARKRSRVMVPAAMPVMLGAVLIRLGEWIQGTVRSTGTPADPVALAAR